MINRILRLPTSHSFFIFGPRQTGKSTLLQTAFPPEKTLYYDLLLPEEYLRLVENPALFKEEIGSSLKPISHVVVDEIQRVPELLNSVHHLMERKKDLYFCLSGSSARKLKRHHANLLAGRAWTYHLYPLTHIELGPLFSLNKALEIGTLPGIYLHQEKEEVRKTLQAYVDTYLNEEIEQEAVTRNLRGFLKFLTLMGDENGHILNYSNIARDTGNSNITVREYLQILEDTLVGFLLFPFSRSARKRLIKHPKFYFFDTGVQRALAKKLTLGLQPGTAEFGKTFEHFVILEMIRLAVYREMDYRFYFYRTASHVEIDLIVETPQNKIYAIEIKASANPGPADLRHLKSFAAEYPNATLLCASLAPRARELEHVLILPWQEIFQAVGIMS